MEKQGQLKIIIIYLFIYLFYFTMDGGACFKGKQVDVSLDKIKLKTKACVRSSLYLINIPSTLIYF